MSDERDSDAEGEPPPAPPPRPDPQLITYIEKRDDASTSTGTTEGG